MIFSAGIAQIIEEILLEKKSIDLLKTKNINVIGNRLIFNDDGEVIDFCKPIIHSMNKKVGCGLCQSICADKTAYIVIGDNIGDSDMIDGVNADCVLKIGLLNDRIEDRLPQFLETFDIVITNDESFSFINELLKNIINNDN